MLVCLLQGRWYVCTCLCWFACMLMFICTYVSRYNTGLSWYSYIYIYIHTYITLCYVTLRYVTLHTPTHICTNRLCIQVHGTYCKNRVIAQNIPSPKSITLVGLLRTQRMMREKFLQPTECFGAVTCHTLRKRKQQQLVV